MATNIIGQNIKTRRKFLKISQKDLSELSGVSIRTIKAILK